MLPTDSYFPLFLAQEKFQKNIHPHQTSPYIGRLKKFFAETAEKFYVLVGRDTTCIVYRLPHRWRAYVINTLIPLSAAFPRASRKKIMARPSGHRLREPYQNFENRRSLRFSTTSLPYREGLGLGGCFFGTFFAPKKVGKIPRHAAREKAIWTAYVPSLKNSALSLH